MRSPTTMEAEVPGLDHPGVDRPDRDLVRRRRRALAPSSAASAGSWLTSGRSGSWPPNADAVQVVRLALVPAGGRREVDDRSDDALVDRDALAARIVPSGAASRVRTTRPVRARVQAGEARSPRQAPRRRARGRSDGRASREPPDERVDELRAGQHDRSRGKRRAVRTADDARSATVDAAQAGNGAALASERCRRRLSRSAAWARPRKPSASRSAVALAAQGWPAWKPPATISTSLTKSGEGGRPESAAQRDPHRGSERAARCGAMPRDRVARRPAIVAAAAASPRRTPSALGDGVARRRGSRRQRALAGSRSRSPSAITPMCSRLEYASSRFQGMRRARGTAPRRPATPSPKTIRTVLGCAARRRRARAPAGSARRRAARSGSSAAGEQGRDGRRCLRVRIR